MTCGWVTQVAGDYVNPSFVLLTSRSRTEETVFPSILTPACRGLGVMLSRNGSYNVLVRHTRAVQSSGLVSRSDHHQGSQT